MRSAEAADGSTVIRIICVDLPSHHTWLFRRTRHLRLRYSYYPRKIQLEPNVSVQMCLHTRTCWAPGMWQDELHWYQDWVSREKGRPLYVWLYHCLPELHNVDGPVFRCFPGFHAHAVGEQFRTFARDGIRGAFIEGSQCPCSSRAMRSVQPR